MLVEQDVAEDDVRDAAGRDLLERAAKASS